MRKKSTTFKSMVFDDDRLKRRISPRAYYELRHRRDFDCSLSLSTLTQIATAMKNWAIAKGATHYTHWFQPLNGATAQKRNSFLSPSKSGAIFELSAKELIKGESDASSFPSGGLRSTFEARGYTAWDPSSYAFVKDETLYIPTAFCSYTGDALDKKTPLLRSMEALSKEGARLLSVLGKRTSRVRVNVGAEQEYFLLDSALYAKRKDLFYTGRTLFGAPSPKGQELAEHYFGAIKPRVAEYMKELDEELSRLGILAKTEHNESAPSQYELAPLYADANVSADQNQLIVETMKAVAAKHGLTCVFHEKPFDGVNGSGKHNNWSLSDDSGNLFEQGESPKDNARFLLMLCAVICAVDEHQDLLRASIASASNDLRLGANEAPPTTISIFLGDELTGILQAVADGRTYSRRAKCEVQIGASVLPKFAMDASDRNRTSPIAFTGNKFEFRMLGSSQALADVNLVLNAVIAEQFKRFANELENASDVADGISTIIKNSMRRHGKIIFNGNCYSPEWQSEARLRGLLSFPSTPDVLPCLTAEKNLRFFKEYGIFSEAELRSRQEIYFNDYCRTVKLEAATMLDVARTDIIPAIIGYKNELLDVALKCQALNRSSDVENGIYARLSLKLERIEQALRALDDTAREVEKISPLAEKSKAYCNRVLPKMQALRASCDDAEADLPTSRRPFPSYGELLYCE